MQPKASKYADCKHDFVELSAEMSFFKCTRCRIIKCVDWMINPIEIQIALPKSIDTEGLGLPDRAA
jgi:hypothetical protein